MLILVVKVPKRFSVSNQPVGALSAAGASPVRLRVLRGRRRGETVPHGDVIWIFNRNLLFFWRDCADAVVRVSFRYSAARLQNKEKNEMIKCI